MLSRRQKVQMLYLGELLSLGVARMKSKEDLYRDAIQILNCVELVIEDKRQLLIIRKKLLDLANDILKCGDSNAG